MLNLTALKNPSRHKLAAQKDLHQTKEHIDEHQRDDANVEVEDPNPNEANWLPDGMSQVQQTRRIFSRVLSAHNIHTTTASCPGIANCQSVA